MIGFFKKFLKGKSEEEEQNIVEETEVNSEAEAEAKRKAEEEAERKRQEAEAEAEAKRKAEEEAERKRKEAEAEAEAKRKAEEEAEAERKRQEAEAEAKRKAEEEAEAERKRQEAEAEAKRKAEEEAERKRQEAEAEAEAKRKAEEEAAAAEGKKKKRGFFQKLVEGLTKTRNNIVSKMDDIFRGFSKIDEDFYEELEEILIMGDLGVHATENVLEDLRRKVKEQHIKEPMACKQILIESIKEQMRVEETAYRFEHETSVVLIIGVNGVGKTTTVGKMAAKLKNQGKKVVIAGADTFRAAAGDQLKEWANRCGVDMIGGVEGADPGSVVFDAAAAARARKADVLLVDTAGRLHNKKNLMNELGKINKILTREFPDAYRETLVVLDATTGQNALVQAREFSEVAEITGIVLTKMDGTAKGGIAVAIQSELAVPVKYIGVGETIDDLQKFNSDEFVNALFNREEDDKEEEEC